MPSAIYGAAVRRSKIFAYLVKVHLENRGCWVTTDIPNEFVDGTLTTVGAQLNNLVALGLVERSKEKRLFRLSITGVRTYKSLINVWRAILSMSAALNKEEVDRLLPGLGLPNLDCPWIKELVRRGS